MGSPVLGVSPFKQKKPPYNSFTGSKTKRQTHHRPRPEQSRNQKHHQNAPAAVAHDVLPNETEMRNLLRTTGFTDIQITDKPAVICVPQQKHTIDPKKIFIFKFWKT
jgi:hypothetical protein